MNAKATVDRDFAIGKIDPRIYGSFIEHLGRVIYGGIYEPLHPRADANGFRRDVIDVVKELRVPLIRYPGGNYSSSYDWRDSVGPVAERPARPDLAWRSLEPNTFGLDELDRWSKELPAGVLMTLNMGTQGLREAIELLEYCNLPGGTSLSDLRRRHGREKPYGIKLWCLGNEIDGPWQVGQKSAAEYGRLANETAKAMKLLDPEVKVCVCGSSFLKMPTFPEWEQTVLDLCYDNVDYLSLHTYCRNERAERSAYLAEPVGMERYLETALGVCDRVRLKKGAAKRLDVSFDEWNVWPRARESDRDRDPWQVAPPLLEEAYTTEDALVFACMLNVLLRHAERVPIACLSLLVNALAPIMTETGGAVWRQTTFYPFKYACLYGTGSSLRLAVDGPVYEDRVFGSVPFLDASAAYDSARGEIAVFLVNRSDASAIDLELALGRGEHAELIEHVVLESGDPMAGNDAGSPGRVVPRRKDGPSESVGGAFRLSLPAFSWNMIRLAL